MRFGSLFRKKENKPSAVSFEDEKNAENNAEGTELTSPTHATNTNNNHTNDANKPPPTTNEVLDTVIEVRADAILALKRTEGTLKLAEESGQESVKVLRTNDETLKRAERIADEMELRTLNKEVVTIGRRLSRDKCFLCLALLVFIGIVIAIVLPQVKPFFGPPDTRSSNPNNYTASSTNETTSNSSVIESNSDVQQ